MMHRYTVITVEAGQPGPYQDHNLRVQVYFEVNWCGFGGKTGFEPREMEEESVKEALRGLQCGYTDFVGPHNTMQKYFTPTLKHLKMVEPGRWEFLVTEPFTD
jgi:hypothetical protein